MGDHGSGATGSRRSVIGVVPALERRWRTRLLDALEAAYPVRFEGREAGAVRDLDGLLVFGAGAVRAAEHGAQVPTLCAHKDERATRRAREVAFAEHPALPAALRGAHLSEAHAAGVAPLPADGAEVVLATIDGSPAWVRRGCAGGPHDRVALAPAELGPVEVLRTRLAGGRSLAVLALVQFLRDLTAARRWRLPATRAAFVIDDPNLRWPTYGHVSYAELSRSALTSGYHVSIAMVPLDGWPAHPRAVTLFHERREQLSLCIHGNNHYGGELGHQRTSEAQLAQVAQALRRVRAFERRTALRIDRVMVPPHERMSTGAAGAMLACGYEAVAGTRTFPWLEQASSPDVPWLTRPDDADVLTGWGSAVLMPGGLPMLVRMPFEDAREEIVIRAFLGQPVVLYGHHDLLEHGPEGLQRAAAAINRLGDTHWSSLGGIARGAVESRRSGAVLELRMLGRRVEVDVPAWATEVRIDTSDLSLPEQANVLARASGSEWQVTRATAEAGLAVSGPCRLELSLERAVDPDLVPTPRRRLAPVARRLGAELRPRTRQLAGRRRGSP